MTRTLFLSVDGRHVTLGRGVDHEPPEELARQVRTLGLRGFLAVQVGDYWGSRPVRLLHRANLDATEAEWPDAIAAFEALRAEARR